MVKLVRRLIERELEPKLKLLKTELSLQRSVLAETSTVAIASLNSTMNTLLIGDLLDILRRESSIRFWENEDDDCQV